MADDEGEGVGLPQKGLNMIIKDALPEMRIANETRELLNQCCVEFIKHVSKEAQQISSKDQRKTIYHDHVQKALKKLGFPREYVDAANSVLGECKIAAEKRLKRKNSRLDKCGIPEEQLWQMQQRLIEQARRNEAEKEQTIYGGPSHYSGADFQFQQQYQMLQQQQQQQQQYYQFQPQYLQAQQQNQFIQSAAQFPGSSSAMMGIGMPSSMATTMTGAAGAGASAMVPSAQTMIGSMAMPTPPTSLQMPPLQWSMPPLPFGEIAPTTMAPQQLHQQQQIQTPTTLLQSLGLAALTPDAVGTPTATATTESGIATTAPVLAQPPQIGNNGQQQMVGGTTTTGLMSAADAAFQQHLIFLQQQQQQSTSSSATPMMMALLNFDKEKKKKKKQKTTAPVADGGDGGSGQKYGGADAEDDGDEDDDEDEEEEEEEEEEEDYDV